MEDESASYVHEGLAPIANVQNIAINTKSPFNLHSSDHPSLIFVTQPLSENGENYFTWKHNTLTALQSKNKAGFVDGSTAKPNGVWNELQNLKPLPVCTSGARKKMQETREEEKVINFLIGLDDAYKTVRSQILNIDPLPRLGRAYAVAA
ncbi:hypothetical protein RJ639_021761 [Escallonia herrerae]|uniref:Retrotransposon Copia-like N-terminal domain-containing protein n=1 Tax=Escallonia herrerae TaxID=1293975 RepID=A0AA88V3K0_9ASTE|nr:hypothetical protein RJ639_021761 [Escallonia herrerae]